jgi:4-amino-4-deoxy-L-arabinose transferase-like glycosyltransferase
MDQPLELRTRSLLLLFLAALLIWFGNLDYRKLIKPDEGRYAEISREMAAGGDWVTPRLNGIKYFEKPPLHYWASAAAMTLFGPNEWVARLWSSLTALAGLVLAWYAGTRLFGAAGGLYSALVLGSSLMYAAMGHLNTLDMGLTLFLFLALCGFLLAMRDGATRRENALGMHAAWAAIGLAVLTKGLIGLVIPGATLVIYTLAQRDWRLWRKLHPITGLLLFLAITVPWFALVSLRNPEFAWFFFVHEHLLRYTTKVHRRDEPWHYFLPLLLAGGLPWTVVMLDAAWRAWLPQPGARFQPRRFLLIWCLFIFLFFSASGSKLPSYILPLFPALALLAGWRLTFLSGKALAWQLAPVLVLALIVLAGLPFFDSSGDTPGALIRAYKPWLAAAALVALLAAAAAMWQSRRGRAQHAVVSMAFGALLSIQLFATGHESLSPSMSAYWMAQKVKPYLEPGVPFYSVATYDQTLPFYIGRTVTLVQFRDEMDFGLQQEPQLAIATVDEWMQTWKRQPYALAQVDAGLYEQLKSAGFPMQLIANDHRRYYIKTR